MLNRVLYIHTLPYLPWLYYPTLPFSIYNKIKTFTKKKKRKNSAQADCSAWADATRSVGPRAPRDLLMCQLNLAGIGVVLGGGRAGRRWVGVGGQVGGLAWVEGSGGQDWDVAEDDLPAGSCGTPGSVQLPVLAQCLLHSCVYAFRHICNSPRPMQA